MEPRPIRQSARQSRRKRRLGSLAGPRTPDKPPQQHWRPEHPLKSHEQRGAEKRDRAGSCVKSLPTRIYLLLRSYAFPLSLSHVKKGGSRFALSSISAAKTHFWQRRCSVVSGGQRASWCSRSFSFIVRGKGGQGAGQTFFFTYTDMVASPHDIFRGEICGGSNIFSGC